MSSLLFLSNDDFFLKNSENGVMLAHGIRGFSLVLFYATNCIHCPRVLPTFKRLPELVNGCQFAMVNVSSNHGLVQKARQSITPITYVPLIILYVNGMPYIRYDGPSDEQEIRKFILEMSNHIQETGFASAPGAKKGKTIPAYTIGNPLVGEDNRCYLEYEEAY